MGHFLKTLFEDNTQAMTEATDVRFMRHVVALARGTPLRPFAAVIAAASGEILVEGRNRHDESAIWHAETDAICNLDIARPGGDRGGLTLYTSAEPCPMCQAAILFAGIPRVVFGASIPFLVEQGWWQIGLRAAEIVARAPERSCELVGGVLDADCRALFTARS